MSQKPHHSQLEEEGERIYVNNNEEKTKMVSGAASVQKRSSSSSSSSTGQRSPISNNPTLDPEILLYRPAYKYGFHTHAYVIHTKAAAKLLQNLPVVGLQSRH